MEFKEVMVRRYSCRNFSGKKVERELLTDLMEAGRIAPSACNSQRWAFIAVDDPDVKSRLAGAIRDDEMGLNQFADAAPAYIALVQHPLRTNNPRTNQLLSSSKDQWGLVDIGIAAQQICLAATDLGLGTVIVGWFDQQKAKEVLKVPDEMEIMLFIAVGYPADSFAREKIRYQPDQIMHYNQFNNGHI